MLGDFLYGTERPEEFPRYHRAMLDYGLELVNPVEDIARSHEVAYQNKEKHLYIEVHKTPFPPDSGAYGDLNTLFAGVLDRHMTVTIYGQQFETLAPTDHMLYLICHAYKHFLHSGVGIRQVADMALFANAYGGDIDWEHIYRACRSVNIETFTAALLQIAHKYLTMNTIPDAFTVIEVDEQPLLEDILSGGYARISVPRKSACGHDCEECAGCGMTGAAIYARAKNDPGAKPGQKVVVESSTKRPLGVVLLVYILPVICFLLGYFLTEGLAESTRYVIAVVAAALAFIPCVIYDRYARRHEILTYTIMRVF